MKNVEFSKKLNIYETKEFDFNKLKFYKSLDNNITFNHFVFAVLGQAFHDLLKCEAPHIVATFPVNYWIPSENVKKVTLSNNICSVVFELPLISSIKEVGKVRDNINKSFIPITVPATNWLASLLSNFPFFIFHLLFSKLNKNNDVILSNVSGAWSKIKFAD